MEIENDTRFRIVDADKDYSKINTVNMEIYLSASAQVDMLNNLIISPFEEQLKKDTGLSKEKPPIKLENKERRIGNHMFYISIKPTHNPKYGEAFNFINDYIDGLEHGNLEGKKREGVRTSEEGMFVSLEDIINNFTNAVEQSRQPSVEFKIKTSKGKDDQELTKTVLQLDYSREYGITECVENARDYIEASKIVDKLDEVIIKPFEKAVKEQTGFNKDNIPDEVKYTEHIVGNVLCYGVNFSQEVVSYGKIMGDFKKYLEELAQTAVETSKSTIPELRRFDGKEYVSIPAIKKKLDGLKNENTDKSLRQNIYYLKRPKDDRIIIE